MQKVLIVDDDDMFRSIMGKHLNALGFEVIEVEDGRRVEALIDVLRPAAVFLDILMPEREGMEVLLALNQRKTTATKVIAVSSNPIYVDIAKKFAIDAALCKPITPDKLQQVLTELGIYKR